jgi:Domain of unknown function (DUF6485)
MSCRQGKGNKDCTCTYTSCSKWGICCECIASHREKDEIPACYFGKEDEKAYDRSMDFFIKQYKKRGL